VLRRHKQTLNKDLSAELKTKRCELVEDVSSRAKNKKTGKKNRMGKKSIIEKFCVFYVFIMRSVCQIMIMARNISFIEL